jgi:hypothetical protein
VVGVSVGASVGEVGLIVGESVQIDNVEIK